MHIKTTLASAAAFAALASADYLGSSCDPVYNTTVCNSSTQLLTCNQNVWTLLSTCENGVFCKEGRCVDENQPSSTSDSSSDVSTVSYSTTVMSPMACLVGKVYNINDKYSDCVGYDSWLESFIKEEESKSEDYFTFTKSYISSTTNGGVGRWSGVGGKAVVAAVALGVSGAMAFF